MSSHCTSPKHIHRPPLEKDLFNRERKTTLQKTCFMRFSLCFCYRIWIETTFFGPSVVHPVPCRATYLWNHSCVNWLTRDRTQISQSPSSDGSFNILGKINSIVIGDKLLFGLTAYHSPPLLPSSFLSIFFHFSQNPLWRHSVIPILQMRKKNEV